MAVAVQQLPNNAGFLLEECRVLLRLIVDGPLAPITIRASPPIRADQKLTVILGQPSTLNQEFPFCRCSLRGGGYVGQSTRVGKCRTERSGMRLCICSACFACLFRCSPEISMDPVRGLSNLFFWRVGWGVHWAETFRRPVGLSAS